MAETAAPRQVVRRLHGDGRVALMDPDAGSRSESELLPGGLGRSRRRVFRAPAPEPRFRSCCRGGTALQPQARTQG